MIIGKKGGWGQSTSINSSTSPKLTATDPPSSSATTSTQSAIHTNDKVINNNDTHSLTHHDEAKGQPISSSLAGPTPEEALAATTSNKNKSTSTPWSASATNSHNDSSMGPNYDRNDQRGGGDEFPPFDHDPHHDRKSNEMSNSSNRVSWARSSPPPPSLSSTTSSQHHHSHSRGYHHSIDSRSGPSQGRYNRDLGYHSHGPSSHHDPPLYQNRRHYNNEYYRDDNNYHNNDTRGSNTNSRFGFLRGDSNNHDNQDTRGNNSAPSNSNNRFGFLRGDNNNNNYENDWDPSESHYSSGNRNNRFGDREDYNVDRDFHQDNQRHNNSSRFHNHLDNDRGYNNKRYNNNHYATSFNSGFDRDRGGGNNYNHSRFLGNRYPYHEQQPRKDSRFSFSGRDEQMDGHYDSSTQSKHYDTKLSDENEDEMQDDGQKKILKHELSEEKEENSSTTARMFKEVADQKTKNILLLQQENILRQVEAARAEIVKKNLEAEKAKQQETNIAETRDNMLLVQQQSILRQVEATRAEVARKNSEAEKAKQQQSNVVAVENVLKHDIDDVKKANEGDGKNYEEEERIKKEEERIKRIKEEYYARMAAERQERIAYREKRKPRTRGVLFKRLSDGTIVNADWSEKEILRRTEKQSKNNKKESRSNGKEDEKELSSESIIAPSEHHQEISESSKETKQNQKVFVPAPAPSQSAWVSGPPPSMKATKKTKAKGNPPATAKNVSSDGLSNIDEVLSSGLLDTGNNPNAPSWSSAPKKQVAMGPIMSSWSAFGGSTVDFEAFGGKHTESGNISAIDLNMDFALPHDLLSNTVDDDVDLINQNTDAPNNEKKIDGAHKSEPKKRFKKHFPGKSPKKYINNKNSKKSHNSKATQQQSNNQTSEPNQPNNKKDPNQPNKKDSGNPNDKPHFKKRQYQNNKHKKLEAKEI